MRAPRSRCLRREDEDFHEQTAMEAVISFLQTYGRPHQITCDRDPTLGRKCVGPGFSLTAASARGSCLGMTPAVCLPHRPDKNAYVERYHRTYGQECFQLHRPSTRKAGARGHRGVSPALQRRTSPKGGEPVAMSHLVWPFQRCLPYPLSPSASGPGCLADFIESYLRHVGRDGCVELDLATSSIGPHLAGRPVLFQLIAENRQFVVWHQEEACQAACYQRSGRAGDGPLRLSQVYPARSVGKREALAAIIHRPWMSVE
ncbi:MAG: hypothetical protein ACJ8DI_09120 [Ktedonobacteraceae bacterium]